MRKIIAINNKHRRVTNICPHVLAGCSLFPLQISLLWVECRWHENLTGKVGACTRMLQRHICKTSSQQETNASYFSEYKISTVLKNSKSAPSYFFGLDLDVIPARAQSISRDCPFKVPAACYILYHYDPYRKESEDLRYFCFWSTISSTIGKMYSLGVIGEHS